MLPGRPTGRDWADPSADGDSPVVVRARVGPVVGPDDGSADVTPTPGEDARPGRQPQAATVDPTDAFVQEAASW